MPRRKKKKVNLEGVWVLTKDAGAEFSQGQKVCLLGSDDLEGVQVDALRLEAWITNGFVEVFKPEAGGNADG